MESIAGKGLYGGDTPQMGEAERDQGLRAGLTSDVRTRLKSL